MIERNIFAQGILQKNVSKQVPKMRKRQRERERERERKRERENKLTVMVI
jgi:hypothetical protein